MKRKITFYILFILMLGSIGTKAFALPSESFGSPRTPLYYVSSFSNAVKNDYSSRWNSGDIREMGSVVGEGLITLLTAGVKYADNAGKRQYNNNKFNYYALGPFVYDLQKPQK